LSVLTGRLVSWVSLGAVGVLGISSAALSVATAPERTSGPSLIAVPQASIAGFAGYTFRAPVTEVAAAIIVPEVLSFPANAGFGTASTWIGAQNAAGWFVQLGITEYQGASASGGSKSGPILQAFWSDTDRHFHPVTIARVHAGDRISLQMKQQRGGWNLRLDDLTGGWVRNIATDYAAGQVFTFSEWVQEDPVSSADPLRNLPYPDMSQVTFSDAEADGRTPPINESDARAMDVPGGPYLVPTAYVAGRFDVVQATSYARQYLSDLAEYDLVEEQFAFALQNRPLAHRGPIIAAGLALVRALDAFEEGLADQTWPAGARANVGSLLYNNYLLSEDLRHVASGNITLARLQRVVQDQSITEVLSKRVRADLGLPPPP
jgi:hypothetical protein